MYFTVYSPLTSAVTHGLFKRMEQTKHGLIRDDDDDDDEDDDDDDDDVSKPYS
jgi:hypothetical protein